MGTGLMKCSFSRPWRFVDSRFASSRMERCFVTAWRLMSSPLHSSLSVWPSFRRRLSKSRRRLGSARARKTASSSSTSANMQPLGCLSRGYRRRLTGTDPLLEEVPLHRIARERERRGEVTAREPPLPAPELELAERGVVEGIAGEAVRTGDGPDLLESPLRTL